MNTTIKILAIILIGLYFSACTSKPILNQSKIEWDINEKDEVAVDKFVAHHKECKDFAFKAVVNGSPYYESDIYNTCLYRKGYKTRLISQGNQ